LTRRSDRSRFPVSLRGFAKNRAVFAGFTGERVMASTTSVVVAINGFFLSFPISIVLETRGPYQTDIVTALLTALLAPFAAMLVGSRIDAVSAATLTPDGQTSENPSKDCRYRTRARIGPTARRVAIVACFKQAKISRSFGLWLLSIL
jgi:hypothetical protein